MCSASRPARSRIWSPRCRLRPRPRAAAKPGLLIAASASPTKARAGGAAAKPGRRSRHGKAPRRRRRSARVAPKAGKASDRIELDTTQISGNRELPKVMYVVPWRKADPGEFTGQAAQQPAR
jgi:hypothetical protein